MRTFAWITGDRPRGTYTHLDVDIFKRGQMRLPKDYQFGAMTMPFADVIATMPRVAADIREHSQTDSEAVGGAGSARHRGHAVFLIGAGCSASAGIPLAAGVAKQAILRIADDYGVERDGPSADEDVREHQREWSQMTFYLAEAVQAQAERERRGDDDAETAVRNARKLRLEKARQFYAAALPGLSSHNGNKAKECKEGLGGAFIALAEYEGDGMGAASRLREAQTLFREVVQWTGMNTPGEQHAGALENLAEAIRSMRLKFNDDAHGSRVNEAQLFDVALGIYETLGDEDSAGRIRNRLHGE